MKLKESAALLLALALFIVTLVLAAVGGALNAERGALAERLIASEANTRYFHGLSVKQEEAHHEELQQVDGQRTAAVWKLEQDLEACLRGKK